MTQLVYKSATGGDVSLDGKDIYVGIAASVRSRVWGYELMKNRLASVSRKARVADIRAWMTRTEADRLRTLADADLVYETPGTLVAQGEWCQAAYIVEQVPETIGEGFVIATLKVVLLEGCWWRIVTRQFVPGSGSVDATDGLDYEYDYEHDYCKPAPGASLDTGLLVPAKPFITFYGSGSGGVVNPFIIIGDNRYQVNTTLSAGDRIEVDGRAHTVTRILAGGTRTSLFSNAVRSGSGSGYSTSYIFQPVPVGAIPLTWDDSHGIDVGWYEEVGEPPWTTS